MSRAPAARGRGNGRPSYAETKVVHWQLGTAGSVTQDLIRVVHIALMDRIQGRIGPSALDQVVF